MAELSTRWKTLTPDNKRSLIFAALFFAFAAAYLVILFFPSLAPYSRVLAALMLPLLAATFIQMSRNASNREILDNEAMRLQGRVDAKRKETSTMLEAAARKSERRNQP